MLDKKFTYRIPLFVSTALITELIWWIITWQALNIFGVFSKIHTEKIIFLYPEYSWLFLIIIPLLIGLFFYQISKRNRLVKQFGDSKTIYTFLFPVSTKKVLIRFFLIRTAAVFLIFAMMQPTFGTKTIHATSNQLEMVFAVDVSNSMNTRDMKGGESRLIVTKRAANQIINQTSPFQVGILIFAGNAYPQLPLTPDIEIAKMYINELNTNLMSNQGTNLAAALISSSKLFTNDDNKKVLIIITDGEDHEGSIEQAYSDVKEKNIDTYIIGLGSPNGGIVPENAKVNSAFMKDRDGQVVVSKINEKMLRNIADKLGGTLFISADSFPPLSEFLTQINSSQTGNSVNLEITVKENRYQLPLTWALLILLILFIWECFPIKRKQT